MKRNQKIILSSFGILIIVIALIGFTYGYYVTNISGNTNAKSIEVQAGKSSATFTDLSEESISEIITPGYSYTKLFTVQNTGNVKAKYSIYFMNVVNEFIRNEDITYTLYRKAGNNTIDISNLSDETIVKTGTFPKFDSAILEDEEIAIPNNYYTYALKIDYVDLPQIDQSDDMNHIFGGEVQIYGSSNYINPYEEGTLAYNIINNSLNSTSGTKYKKVPLTEPASDISLDNESVLSTVEDDLGVSYYYRGKINDNYLNYSGMCFRIVRIEGDGSIKLILANPNATCSDSMGTNSAIVDYANFGYKTSSDNYKVGDYLNTDNNAESLKYKLDSWLIQTNIDQSKLKNDDWCLEDQTTVYDYDVETPLTSEVKQQRITNSNTIYYGANKRLTFSKKSPTLKCDGTKYKNKIGSLTADEVAFAGGTYLDDNYTYYLRDNVTSDYWWTMSFSDFDASIGDYIFVVSNTGNIFNYDNISANNAVSFRSVITLMSNVTSTGNGTLSSPYVVN